VSDQVLGYGIDFGTTNSLISIAYKDRVEVVKLTKGAAGDGLAYCLPSVVYFDRFRDYRAGEDAIQQYVYVAGNRTQCNRCGMGCDREEGDVRRRPGEHRRLKTACVDARLASGLKMNLADDCYRGTDSWCVHFNLSDMVAWVLRDLHGAVDDSLRPVSVPIVVGVPVEYASQGNGSRAYALEQMRQAVKVAGFKKLDFLEEPKAALVYELAEGNGESSKGVCVAVDFGGGTFDVAVSKSGVTPWGTDMVKGVAVGGEHLDSLIFTNLLASKLGIEPVLQKFGRRLMARSPMIMSTGDSEFRNSLAKAKAERVRGAAMLLDIFERGQVYDLWKAIESAKVQLSTKPTTHVVFSSPTVKFDEEITRLDFERAIVEQLASVRQTILDALGAAKVKASDVALVVKTGGSSALPSFDRILTELFPTARIEKQPALTTIAEGLGHYVRIQAGASVGGHSAEVVKPLIESSKAKPAPLPESAVESQVLPSDSHRPNAPKATEPAERKRGGLVAALRRLMGWK